MRHVVVVLLASCSAILLGQDTGGTISGTVTDPQGAAIGGAAVTITNTGTGTSSKLETNSNGYYEAPRHVLGLRRVLRIQEVSSLRRDPGHRRTTADQHAA
jgi:hypothetical protein